jgi:hypothetical protein
MMFIALFGFGFVLFIWIAWPILLPIADRWWGGSEPNSVIFGQFGDSFGGLTSLFTGLAFGLIALSLFIQNKQMKKLDEQINQQADHFEKMMDHLKKEDQWTRLKTKIEVLPSLCGEKEYEIKVLATGYLPEDYDYDGFSMSPERLGMIESMIIGKISEAKRINDFDNERIQKLENEIADLKEKRSEMLKTEEGHNQMVALFLDGKETPKVAIENKKSEVDRIENSIKSRDEQINRLNRVLALIEEIRIYRSDLAGAYKSVQET